VAPATRTHMPLSALKSAAMRACRAEVRSWHDEAMTDAWTVDLPAEVLDVVLDEVLVPRCQSRRSAAWRAGAPEGIRTPNLLIRSQMLYPLSYGRSAPARWKPRRGLHEDSRPPRASPNPADRAAGWPDPGPSALAGRAM
jgi:hypothetical protein